MQVLWLCVHASLREQAVADVASDGRVSTGAGNALRSATPVDEDAQALRTSQVAQGAPEEESLADLDTAHGNPHGSGARGRGGARDKWTPQMWHALERLISRYGYPTASITWSGSSGLLNGPDWLGVAEPERGRPFSPEYQNDIDYKTGLTALRGKTMDELKNQVQTLKGMKKTRLNYAAKLAAWRVTGLPGFRNDDVFQNTKVLTAHAADERTPEDGQAGQVHWGGTEGAQRTQILEELMLRHQSAPGTRGAARSGAVDWHGLRAELYSDASPAYWTQMMVNENGGRLTRDQLASRGKAIKRKWDKQAAQPGATMLAQTQPRPQLTATTGGMFSTMLGGSGGGGGDDFDAAAMDAILSSYSPGTATSLSGAGRQQQYQRRASSSLSFSDMLTSPTSHGGGSGRNSADLFSDLGGGMDVDWTQADADARGAALGPAHADGGDVDWTDQEIQDLLNGTTPQAGASSSGVGATVRGWISAATGSSSRKGSRKGKEKRKSRARSRQASANPYSRTSSRGADREWTPQQWDLLDRLVERYTKTNGEVSWGKNSAGGLLNDPEYTDPTGVLSHKSHGQLTEAARTLKGKKGPASNPFHTKQMLERWRAGDSDAFENGRFAMRSSAPRNPPHDWNFARRGLLAGLMDKHYGKVRRRPNAVDWVALHKEVDGNGQLREAFKNLDRSFVTKEQLITQGRRLKTEGWTPNSGCTPDQRGQSMSASSSAYGGSSMSAQATTQIMQNQPVTTRDDMHATTLSGTARGFNQQGSSGSLDFGSPTPWTEGELSAILGNTTETPGRGFDT